MRFLAYAATRHLYLKMLHQELSMRWSVDNNRRPQKVRARARAADENDDGIEQRIVIDRATIPVEPVNAFGIPQATMRCLEVSDFSEIFGCSESLTPSNMLSLRKVSGR